MRHFVLFCLTTLGIGTALALAGQYSSPDFGDASYGISYPNYQITPGKADPDSKEFVCSPGYAKKKRASLSKDQKVLVYQRYGLKYDSKRYQIDHLIPLSLGGSNDLENLWPLPNVKNASVKEKDQTAQWLKNEVCAGKIELDTAQRMMVRDWHHAYLLMRELKEVRKSK